MEIIEVPQPEIPEKGWFSNWAARIVAGDDEELEDILIREFNHQTI
jgi:hypothetical protein